MTDDLGMTDRLCRNQSDSDGHVIGTFDASELLSEVVFKIDLLHDAKRVRARHILLLPGRYTPRFSTA